MCVLVGCSAATTDSNRSSQLSVVISPSAPAIEVGESTRLVASVVNAASSTAGVQWKSSNDSIAVISAAGDVTGINAGTVSITASLETVTASVSLVVKPAHVASVEIAGPITPISVNDSLQLSAVVRDAHDNVLTGRTVTWSSATPATARITSDGIVIGVWPGYSLIQASVDSAASTSNVEIKPAVVTTIKISPGDTTIQLSSSVQLTAIGRDRHGDATPEGALWSSSNVQVATITASGVLTAIAAGVTTVTATMDSVVAKITVTVPAPGAQPPGTPLPVSSVQMTFLGSMQPKDSLQLVAIARDATGAIVTGRPVIWSSDSPAVASVTSGGLLKANAPGGATIRVQVDAASTFQTLLVFSDIPVAIKFLSVPPVEVGRSVEITANVLDANGSVLQPQLKWTISDSTVAKLVPASVSVATITGLKPGTVTVSVSTAPNLSQSVQVNIITPPPPVNMMLIMTNPVAVGAEAAVDVGNVEAGSVTTWASSDSSVAIPVSPVLKTFKAGSATISATNSGFTVSRVLVVTPGPTAFVNWDPNPHNMFVGDTQTVHVQTIDAQQHVITGRPIVWASLNPAMATIDSTGLIRAIAPGQPNLTATADGIPAETFVTVLAVPPSRATMSPSTAQTIHVGQTVQFTAVAYDAQGNPMTATPYWQVVSSGVGTISNTGLFTAVVPGDARVLLEYTNVGWAVTNIVHVLP